MSRTVQVSEYDPCWTRAFANEADALRGVFGHDLIAIHHIGSTSVPGLSAKPIIDILVVLRDTESIGRFSDRMEQLGYRVRGECLDAEIPGTPGRYYFSKDDKGIRTHQVHACAEGHSEIVDKIAFRNYLSAHQRVTAEYGTLKRELAQRFRQDNIGYMRGKDAFVRAALDRAREWTQSASGPARADV